jgi:hypothetical protein
MKNKLLILSFFLVLSGALLFSCQKKKPSEGITPTYGTTGNPNPGYQTVTGTTTYTNPATENSSMYVGGIGWTNPTCGTTQSITLRAINDNIDVTLSFATSIKSGTYAVSTTPAGTSACALTIRNAPNQPAGIIWYGTSGAVIVNTTSTSINAQFSNVVCTQQNFSFPTVSASGVVGCSQ